MIVQIYDRNKNIIKIGKVKIINKDQFTRVDFIFKKKKIISHTQQGKDFRAFGQILTHSFSRQKRILSKRLQKDYDLYIFTLVKNNGKLGINLKSFIPRRF